MIFVLPGNEQADAPKIWERLFPGDAPDGYQRAKANTPTLISSASGQRGNYTWTVNSQVGRIDIICQSSIQPQPGGPVPRIVDISDAAFTLCGMMKKLNQGTKIARLAMVFELSKSVSPGTEGKELRKMLSVFPFPETVTDVSMQFNVRKHFVSSPATQMNRLCAWANGQLAFIGGPGMPFGAPLPMIPFVGCKVDVNTAPETHPPEDKLEAILDELVSEGLQICADGAARLLA
ncbi:hypothetical protein [Teichococcus aestuarii]|uniref:hypothetical protein n=1 Tax=Teichococcus aestuarii TaxID=568898 RepID=UPI00360D3AFF